MMGGKANSLQGAALHSLPSRLLHFPGSREARGLFSATLGVHHCLPDLPPMPSSLQICKGQVLGAACAF